MDKKLIDELTTIKAGKMESYEVLNAIVETSNEGFLELNDQWQIKNVNQAAVELIGLPQAQIIGKDVRILFSAENRVFAEECNVEWSGTREVFFEAYSRSLDRWLEVRAYPLGDYLRVFFRDVTERKKSEEALIRSEELFSKIFGSSSCSMALLNLDDHSFVDINEGFEQVTGYPRCEAVGCTPSDLNLWLEDEIANKFFEQGAISKVETKIWNKPGKIRNVLLSSEIIDIVTGKFLLLTLTDITELKQYQNELVHLNRSNSATRIAASLAHEIRNPITTIRGFLQLFIERKSYIEDQEVFSIMMDELDRVNQIVSEFLSYSGNKEEVVKLRDLNKIINDLHPLLLADAIKAEKNILMNQSPIPKIEVNQKEINQLILNLVRNGLESMDSGGTLIIATWVEDSNIMLSIKDQGSGIPDEILEKLGTECVSTKDDGNGLGLLICYQIAKKNNGELRIETGCEGTNVLIKFKAADFVTE